MASKRVYSVETAALLIHPDGSYDKENLEDILNEVTDKRFPNNRRVRCYRRERDKKFDFNYPSYHDVEFSMTVVGLKRLYYYLNNESYTEARKQDNIRIRNML